MEPSGVELFVVLGYAFLLLLALGYASWRRRDRRAASGTALPSAEELAWLTGGPKRVVETAVAALVHSGAIRLDSDPSLRIGSGPQWMVSGAGRTPPPAGGSVRAEVLAAVERRPMVLRDLIRQAAAGPVVSGVGDRLVELGLRRSDQALRELRWRGVIPLVVLLVAGTVGSLSGVLRTGPAVGTLIALLLMTVVSVVVLMTMRTTAAGWRMIRTFRRATDGRQGPELAVAVQGLTAYRERRKGVAASRPRPSPTRQQARSRTQRRSAASYSCSSADIGYSTTYSEPSPSSDWSGPSESSSTDSGSSEG